MAKTSKYGFGKTSQGTELELPSLSDPDDPESPHNVCRVKRPGAQGLIAAGVLDNFDALTALVQSELVAPNETATGRRPTKAAPKRSDVELLKDEKENILSALDMVDKVILYCVLAPKVYPAPPDGEDRDEDLTYVDDVDLEDKMFILQFVLGGTRDLESFRKGTEGTMAGLATQ